MSKNSSVTAPLVPEVVVTLGAGSGKSGSGLGLKLGHFAADRC